MHVTRGQVKTLNTLCLTYGIKFKKFMTNNLQQQLQTKMFKIIAMKNAQSI